MIETKFKETEVGRIPEDWEVVSLGKLMPLQRGFDLPNAKIVKGKYPIVYSNGIGAFHNEYKCCAPGIITGRSGTIGKFTYIEQGFYWPHNTTLWVTSFSGNNPKFIYFLCNTFNFKESSTGTGVPTLNRNFLRDIQVSIPSNIDEQKKIADALTSVDELISGIKELIEKKQGIKDGAMSEFLTCRKRLPGFNEPWVTKTLNEIGTIFPNNCLSRDQLCSTGTIRNIHYGDILTRFGSIVDASNEDLPYIKPELEEKFLNRESIEQGDIIFADTAEDETVGKAIELINVPDRIVSGLHTIWFRPSSKFAERFLGYILNSSVFHDQIPPLASGVKVCSISKPSLRNLKVSYPLNIEEQQAIADILTSMDSEIEALEIKLNKYEQIKQGMMQQLLTGKIRLI